MANGEMLLVGIVWVYLDDILVLTWSAPASNRAQTFFCSVFWFIVYYILMFLSLNSITLSSFHFWDYTWIE